MSTIYGSLNLQKLTAASFNIVNVADSAERKTAATYDPLGVSVGITKVVQADLDNILWTLIASDVTADASWISAPYSAEPDSAAGIVFSAADTPASFTRLATHKCSGTNDEVEIMAAIALLDGARATPLPGHNENDITTNGGKIIFLPGTYNISSPITVTDVNNLRLEGSGPSTIFNNVQTDQGHCFQFTGTGETYGLNRLELADFVVLGNYTDAGTRSGDGINIIDVHYPRITNLRLLANGGHGMSITSTAAAKGAQNKLVDSCQFQFNRNAGLYTDSLHDFILSHCHFEENYGESQIRMENNVGCDINGCSVEDGYGTYSLYIDGYMPQMSGNTFESNTMRFDPSAAYTGTIQGSYSALEVNGGATDFRLDIAGSRFSNNITINGTGDSKLNIAGSSILNLLLKTESAAAEVNLSGCEIITALSVLTGGTYNGGVITITGGSVGISLIDKCERLTISGTNVTLVGPDINVNTEFTATGISKIAGTATVKAVGSYCRMTMVGCSLHTQHFDFDGNAQTGVRLLIGHNNFRTIGLDIDDIDLLLIQGNIIAGVSAWTIAGVATELVFNGNIFWNGAGVTIAADVVATPVFAVNAVGGLNLTNNGPAETNISNY